MIENFVELFKLVGIGLALMLPLANPLTAMSLYLALGKHLSPTERATQIRLAAWYTVAIMLVAFYAGSWIMHAFGISLPGLRISGGLIVGFLGFTMLFPSDAGPDGETDKQVELQGNARAENIAFVPLALPGTAGPGTIAIIITLASKMHEGNATNGGYPAWIIVAVPVIVAGLLGGLLYVCLRSASRLVSLIGKNGVEAISRVMGFLLVCMGVQFVIDGTYAVIALHRAAG
ncbi:MarC family NAAT transporter [Variovorax sp. J22P168]|uniref:MarC family NAAT transporter n=1 Tax=Variovorax jilinensis TaxID=3053513 RepID=UPI0025773295|nr:MarC family NAAT transporter [Variovorax sp. J22P168]MDM0014970.1 MarC family NAAT transporter [Variovorax sp. J22P168]